jgi:phenylacetate-coenzyme A ligase PaaK-like adenylate-forming protein
LETTESNDGIQELVFSMLSQSLLIPLMRYNSKDAGRIFTYYHMREVLNRHGYSHLCPELKLPMVAVGGRAGRCVTVNDISVYPEEVKQGLYSDFHIAAATTGYFKLSAANNTVLIEVQLRKGVESTPALQTAFKKAIARHLRTDFAMRLYSHSQFPHGMEVDYERKFKHID